MTRLFTRIRFDTSWYLSAYPDVLKAVFNGDFKSAFDHYWRFGRYENRLSQRPPFVDDEWYFSTYSDAKDGMAEGLYSSAFDHYVKVGCQRGYYPFHPIFSISLLRRKGLTE